MSFLFRMTFTGLCAFVPRELQGAERLQGTVLLVNTEDWPDDLNFHGQVRQHEPGVWIRGERIPLRGKELSFSVAPTATIEPSYLQYVNVPLPTQMKPTPRTDEARHVHWIANMEEFGGGKVADECFDPLFGPLQEDKKENKKVAARVRLNAGVLSTSRIIKSTKDPLDDVVWDYQVAYRGKVITQRAMAGEFSLTALVMNDDQIRLDIFDFETSSTDTKWLTQLGGEVVVPVENSCYVGDDRSPLEDFAWFYRLCEDRGALHLPYIPGGGDYTDTMCPPAKFPAHPLA